MTAWKVNRDLQDNIHTRNQHRVSIILVSVHTGFWAAPWSTGSGSRREPKVPRMCSWQSHPVALTGSTRMALYNYHSSDSLCLNQAERISVSVGKGKVGKKP